MITPALIGLLLQAYDPLSGGPPPPPPVAKAPAAAVSGPAGARPRPASYPWPELWPTNYNDGWKGRSAYEPRYLDLPRPDPAAIAAYYKFAEQTINMGMNPPGHRPEEHRDFGPGGMAGRIGAMKVGEVDTWKGRATRPIHKLTPYDGRFEIIGAHPVGAFECRQVKFTMSRGTSSVSKLELYCRDTKGVWASVS